MPINRLIVLFLLAGVLLIHSQPADAQQGDGGSVSGTLAAYLDRIYGVDPALVSGDFYYGPMRGSVAGHPFFFDDQWKEGYIESRGIRYDGLQLKYDVYLNRVVLRYVTRDNSSTQILLRSDLIDRFTLNGRVFVPSPVSRDSSLQKFCELASEGKVDYIIIKTKELNLTNGSSMNLYEYAVTVRQYLVYDERIIPFNGMNALYRIVPDQKKIIRRFIKEGNLKGGPKFVEDRAKIVTFCNTLIPNE